jgi:glyoxylase-like metal-dependent hydrolase (beta-lactamase superfamily II)
MILKKATFTCTTQFEDFISLGGGHVTAAICTSSPPMLFDPGVSAFGPLYLKKLREHTRSTDNLIIALSHAHFDHCGAAAYLMRKIPSARLAASAKGAEILKRPNAVELICRLNSEYEQSMKSELAGEDVSFDALDVNYKLKSGDCIELDGGRVCQVFETPGHTRDSLSYFFPDTGIAFIGDAAGAPEGGFVHSPFLVSYEDYITSIEKIRVLRPAAICMPHCGILTGPEVSRYLSHAIAAALDYKNRIEKYLALYKGDQEKVVARITAEEYDAQPAHIQKRQPFILNLRAKVSAVAVWLESPNH